MSLPGEGLRALAARVCRPVTMARIVDPIIADLRRVCVGDSRARVGECAGAVTPLLKALILHAALSSVAASGNSESVHASPGRRSQRSPAPTCLLGRRCSSMVPFR